MTGHQVDVAMSQSKAVTVDAAFSTYYVDCRSLSSSCSSSVFRFQALKTLFYPKVSRQKSIKFGGPCPQGRDGVDVKCTLLLIKLYFEVRCRIDRRYIAPVRTEVLVAPRGLSRSEKYLIKSGIDPRLCRIVA